jgi:hypothetical protein
MDIKHFYDASSCCKNGRSINNKKAQDIFKKKMERVMIIVIAVAYVLRKKKRKEKNVKSK